MALLAPKATPIYAGRDTQGKAGPIDFAMKVAMAGCYLACKPGLVGNSFKFVTLLTSSATFQ